MEIETSRFPFEAQKLNQAAALALRLRNQLLVIHDEHFEREHLQPISGEPIDLQRPGGAIRQIVGIEVPLGEMLEIAG